MKRWTTFLAVGFTAMVGLAALGQVRTCTLVTYDMEYDSQTAAQTAGWSFERPWRLVSSRDLRGEPEGVRNFPSGTKAAYFGWVRADGTGTYQSDGRVEGVLATPEVAFDRCEGCEYIGLSFKYYREVEYYPTGDYDRTWVVVAFYLAASWEYYEYYPGNGDKRIFRLDSRDPSEPTWKEFTSDPIRIPSGATRVRVLFRFDSVDEYANDYLGWLIDDVKLVCTTQPVRITAERLEQGVVGEDYWSCLWADGPARFVYTWTAEGLPRGLAIGAIRGEPRWACIGGRPESAGTYQVKIKVKAGQGGPGMEDEKTFTLVITAGREELVWAEWFDLDTYCNSTCGAQTPPTGWATEGLWHITNRSRCFWGCGVAYFGQGECQDNYNYETGARTSGLLTSPVISIPAEHAGKRLVVVFWSKREVEDYVPGGYDKAWVEVKVGDGPWTAIWQRDSKEPKDDCVDVRIDTGILLPSATQPIPVRIRFGFDSVDSHANRFFGWAVDSVRLFVSPVPLRVTVSCPLPEGSVGDYYREELTAEGGVRAKRWEVTGLPSGLGVREEGGVWVLAGTPREAGSYNVTLKVRDEQGNEDQKTCLLVINAQLLFKENFEANGPWAQWTATGLWRRTASVCAVDLGTRGHVAYYGRETACDYHTGAPTTGALTSPAFDTLGAKFAKVAFEHWREVESVAGAYDKTYVEARFLVVSNVGSQWTSWSAGWYRDASHPSTKKWEVAEFTVPVPTGATKMQIRFVFDSVDKYYNKFTGWLVDNIKVVKSETAGPSSAILVPTAMPRDRITVINSPNPVRDVHTTTFFVRGVEAEALRIEVYDLTGRLVWRAETAGNELVWHTQDLTGLPLANGVYLYKAYVKIGGTWIVTEVQKVVILR